MKVHLVASQRHYARHARAVWRYLPEELRGREMLGPRAHGQFASPGDVVLVGGFVDIASAGEHRVIYVEHGTGQTYLGLSDKHAPYYPGGRHPDNVIGYVCPSERVAAHWDRPTVVVGCPAVEDLLANPTATPPTAAITFHWDASRVCPEARSARDHYVDHIGTIVTWLRDDGFDVLGHWHPRDAFGPEVWRNLQVPMEPDPDRVLERAYLLIADNTSLLYEAALLDCPVVCLNAPWYRRDVEHGLRFWSHVPGRQVDDVDELLSQPADSYVLDPEGEKLRRAAAAYAYTTSPTGHGGETAARFITDLVG